MGKREAWYADYSVSVKSSQFSKDINTEKWFASILDKVFYPDFISNLNNKSINSSYTIKRISSMDKQHEGIDLIISDKSNFKEYLIDEKAQLHYLNRKLPTFIFELFFVKDGKSKIGWFLDSKKKTTHYFFYRHILTEGEHVKSFRMDSIDIPKLKNYLDELGLDKAYLLEIVDNLIDELDIDDDLFETDKENSYSFKKLPESLNEIITLSLSPHYPESPINLLINLDKLILIEPNLFKQFIYPFPN